MKPIKIKIDRPEISESKIQSFKNFENVLNMAKNGTIASVSSSFTKILLKSTSFWAGTSIGLAVIVGSIFYFTNNNNKIQPANIVKTDSLTQTKKNTFLFNVPIKGKDIEFQSFNINNQRDTIITSAKGSKFDIPKGIFNTINSDNIEVKIREFYTPMDFFLSGIPMEYDSAGQKYTFESAGMFEIRAFSAGKTCSLATGKTISVELKTLSADNSYNIYALNDKDAIWRNKGKGNIIKIKENKRTLSQPTTRKPSDIAEFDTLSNEISTINRNIEQLTKPKLLKNEHFIFKLTFNQTKFPELSGYKNVLFEVNSEYSRFNEALYSVLWDKVELKKSSIVHNYELNLSRRDTTVQLVVYPVVNAKDLETAETVYKNTLKQYEEQKILAEQKKRAVEKAKYTNISAQEMIYTTVQKSDEERFITRKFQITDMGIWNCDRPLPANYKDGMTIHPHFCDMNGKELNYTNLYLVYKGDNALFTFKSAGNVKISKQDVNVMWFVTPKGDIGIVEPAQIDDIVFKKHKETFNTLIEEKDIAINFLKQELDM